MKTKFFTKAISVMIAAIVLVSMTIVGFSASAATMKYNIDTTKKASLRLYKYEMADTSAATSAGTGEYSDNVNIPEGATVLPGVTFKIWKIADLTQYFKPDGVNLPTPAEAEDIITNNTSTPSFTKVTDAQGIAAFTNLPLGIYYVKEIDGPAQVTTPINPFVLSLPLTKTDGSEWMYDVYSFPKNQTSYSDIKVKKVDSSNGNVLQNAKFTLYESVNGRTNWTVRQTDITTAANGVAGINSLPVNMYYRFVETQAPSDAYILDSTASYRFYVDATGDMHSYLISNGETIIKDVIADNTVVVPNEMPRIHKYILDKGVYGNAAGQTFLNPHDYPGESHEGIDNTANIGDTVNWVIKVDVPRNIDKLRTFKVEDTLSTGLQFKSVSAGNPSFSANLTDGDGYTLTQSGQKITLDFDVSVLAEENAGGKTLIILLDTLLTSEAPIATDIPNKSKLIYTNKVDTDSTYDIDSEEPTVHTGGLQFRKTDGTNPLEGVEFKIYATEEDAKNNTNVIATATSNPQGIVTFTGLKYGSFSTDAEGKAANGVDGGSTDYWLVETKTNAGFSLLSAPFKKTVNKTSHIYTNNDDVVNNAIPGLPPTGGIGVTAMFVLSGGMVVLGVIMLLRRKKTHKD